MKIYLTVSACVASLFAFAASAQQAGPFSTPRAIVYPSTGSAPLLWQGGQVYAPPVATTNTATISADAMADLAPAAGGAPAPRPQSDRALNSDSNAGLRGDSALTQ